MIVCPLSSESCLCMLYVLICKHDTSICLSHLCSNIDFSTLGFCRHISVAHHYQMLRVLPHSPQDIENFKAELERRQQQASSGEVEKHAVTAGKESNCVVETPTTAEVAAETSR